jgi:putative ABC transport system substrate-binding protein
MVDLVTRAVLLLVIVLIAAFAGTVARAEDTKKTWTLGILANAVGMDEPILDAFRQTLRELGYVEGQNLRIEFRTARSDANRLPTLAEELVRLKVDTIFVTTTAAARALKRATSTIPIVMVGNLLGSELTLNLAHPGGNLTGFSVVSRELTGKRLQILKEAIPRVTRVAVLWNPNSPDNAEAIKDLKLISSTLGVELDFMGARRPEEFDATFSAISRTGGQAVYVLENSLFYLNRAKLVNSAIKARLPLMCGVRELVEEGALISYGPSYGELYRRAAGYVDKILKGAKPGDLPIEEPIKFELVVNLKTTKALGIKIPESILVRADEVIQ